MRPLVPEYIRSLKPYVPGRPIEEVRRETSIKKILKMASNENPLGPSPKALRALNARALKILHLYPDAGAFRLRKTLSKFLRVSPASLTLGNGSNEIIDSIIRTFCRSGESIITQKAAFIAYKICAQVHGVRTVETSYTENLGFRCSEMLERIREDESIRVAFIANPNNPTGSWIGKAELESFLNEVSRLPRTVIVVLDYAYWEYVRTKDFLSPKAALKFPNVIVLRTFSKIYGLAALRLGYAVGAHEQIAHLERIRQPFNNSTLSQLAGEAALGDLKFVERSRRSNAKEMKFWEKKFREWSVPFFPSQGNFLLFDSMAGFQLTGDDLFKKCINKGLILRPVSNYGLPNHVRLSIGNAKENPVAARLLKNFLPKSSSASRIH